MQPWLEGLTLNQLKALAVLMGSPCSGTKKIRIAGIREAIAQATPHEKLDTGLSLLSIDMGIRNLAFTHISAPVVQGSDGAYQYGKPTIEAWRRLSVSDSQKTPTTAKSGKSSIGNEGDESRSPIKAGKESFEPIDFAAHAYNFIDHILTKHKPNRILIERQRFRSSGQAAVQEWTLRVGVFEGMLYAALRSLAEERQLHLSVEPMLPDRVNRSWLKNFTLPEDGKGEKLNNVRMKQAKIRLVCEMLEETGTKSQFAVSKQLQGFTKDFVAIRKKETKTGKSRSNGIGKLDDLSDSLLQGLAWINWQNNRVRLISLGKEAFDLPNTQNLDRHLST